MKKKKEHRLNVSSHILVLDISIPVISNMDQRDYFSVAAKIWIYQFTHIFPAKTPL
jgi:hypothetical protein